jgi:GntR family transcriptional regulator
MVGKTKVISVSPGPLYLQIKETLRTRILDGTYRMHEQMPSEAEMMKAFKVSRITVRQALNDLQKDGLIFKLRGKGTFVAKPKAFQNVTRLQGFGEAMTPMGYETFSRVLRVTQRSAPKDVAERLKLKTGVEVTEIRRLRYLNREPISLDVTYLPADIGERVIKEDLATRDIFLILENEYGCSLGAADLQIEAMLADDTLARALGIEEGAPVLRIERLTHAADGRPLDYEHLYYRGDAFQYRLTIERH